MLRDAAIGLTFEVGEAGPALLQEADFPADIVLCDQADRTREAATGAAGNIVLRNAAHAVRG